MEQTVVELKRKDDDGDEGGADLFLELRRLDGTRIAVYLDNVFWWAEVADAGCEVWHGQAGKVEVQETYAQVTAVMEKHFFVDRCKRQGARK